MSFRLADLKKSVRKAKDGHQITPARLEGRSAALQIDFVLSHFEEHIGCPRRMLDPDALLEFLGDARVGRGVLATLAQWYRMRARTFAEVLEPSHAPADWRARLEPHGISNAVELRAWLYARVNGDGSGYLDPDRAMFFWEAQARTLRVRRKELEQLLVVDRPEEAMLVRTGPAPSPSDVMAAYNARAHTTLLRSAREVRLRCAAAPALMAEAARIWAGSAEVEWTLAADEIRLAGQVDALGCWTRHGRKVEAAALELLAVPELQVGRIGGTLDAGGKPCEFLWKEELLQALGAGTGAPLDAGAPELIAAVTTSLRRERDRLGGSEWQIRRPAHGIGVTGGFCLPHLELRRGDWGLYLRWGKDAACLEPFREKTPVGAVCAAADGQLIVRLAGNAPIIGAPGEVLSALGEWLDGAKASASRGARRLPAAA